MVLLLCVGKGGFYVMTTTASDECRTVVAVAVARQYPDLQSSRPQWINVF